MVTIWLLYKKLFFYHQIEPIERLLSLYLQIFSPKKDVLYLLLTNENVARRQRERSTLGTRTVLVLSNAFYGVSEALLWIIARLPFTHRSISYGGMADTALGDSRYCDKW